MTGNMEMDRQALDVAAKVTRVDSSLMADCGYVRAAEAATDANEWINDDKDGEED